MDKKEFRYSLLKRVDEGHKDITFESFGVTQDFFEKQVYFMRDEGYIGNVEYHYQGMELSDTRLTEKGEQYLTDNSSFGKIYNILKEAKDWIK